MRCKQLPPPYNHAVTADTAIFTTAPDFALEGEPRTLVLMVASDTEGVLSLGVGGEYHKMNGGNALAADAWYAFDVPLFPGEQYNMKFSANAVLSIRGYWRDEA